MTLIKFNNTIKRLTINNNKTYKNNIPVKPIVNKISFNTIKINNSRLGNLIIMIFNALCVNLEYKVNIIIPKHPFLKVESITVHNRPIRPYGNWPLHRRSVNIPNGLSVFNKQCNSAISKIRKLFLLRSIDTLGSNDLVIHIRSGDIFTRKNPHSRYLCPPVSYYVNIISKYKNGRLILVAEDQKNPTILHLIRLYSNIIFFSKGLKQDIQCILSARNVVMSCGTFIPALLLLSTNITHLYAPSYTKWMVDAVAPRLPYHIEFINYETYAKHMLPWKNSSQQRKYMVTH